MTSRMYQLHNGRAGAAFAIRVTIHARRDEVVRILNDGTVKIRLTAPPVKGNANQALIEFLAEILEISRSQIEIVAGETGRNKLVSIMDLDAETVQKRIMENMI